jgi:hypothetical protein
MKHGQPRKLHYQLCGDGSSVYVRATIPGLKRYFKWCRVGGREDGQKFIRGLLT